MDARRGRRDPSGRTYRLIDNDVPQRVPLPELPVPEPVPEPVPPVEPLAPLLLPSPGCVPELVTPELVAPGALVFGAAVVPVGPTEPVDVPDAPMLVEPMPVLLVLLPGVVVVMLALGVVVVVVVLDVLLVGVVVVDWQPASAAMRAMPAMAKGVFVALMEFLWGERSEKP